MTSNLTTSLHPIDSLEALVLVDNVSDTLSTVAPGVTNESVMLRKAGMQQLSGEAICCAHHGLSLVLTARVGGVARSMMFDAGPEAYAVTRNGDRLGVPFSRDASGRLGTKPLGGSSHARTISVTDHTGRAMLSALWERARAQGVRIEHPVLLLDLVVDDGCQGAVGAI